MTADFETLIYTDCRPGTGLAGTAGFQFQARSPGAGQQAMDLVERHLLYEAPSVWMAERRPVEQYPTSLAHRWDGLLATAAGVYLGREANGGREGNQLTHAIVADHPDSYGSLRPAQLFGAQFWAQVPNATTTCARQPADLEPGAFEVQAVQQFLNSSPHHAELLVALLSTLQRCQDPQAPRVLFIAEDPAAVLRWITLGTVLLPQRQALAVNFKVFTTRPVIGTHHIVAVHPAWQSIDASVDNDHGFVVFDLVKGAWSAVTPTTLARQWVSEFAAAPDPYDVLDAIEVAAGSGQRPEVAAAIGLAAVMGRLPTPDEAAAVVAWLRDGPGGQLELYGGRVADLLVETVERWPASALSVLDEVARSGRTADPASAIWRPERLTAVRGALLAAELRRAAKSGQVENATLAPLPAHVWGQAAQRAAVDAVVMELAAAGPVTFEALLRVARRFKAEVPLGRVREAVHTFVRHWADQPERDYDPRLWSSGDGVRDLLVDELRARARQSRARAEKTADDWWHFVLPDLETVSDALDEAVIGAAMLHQTQQECLPLIKTMLRDADRLDDDTVIRTVKVLFARRPAELAELKTLLKTVPADVPLPERIFQRLNDSLESARQLPEDECRLAQELVQRNNYKPPVQVRRLLDGLGLIPRIAEMLATAETVSQLPRDELRRVPAIVARARRATLSEALLLNKRPLAVLEALPLLPDDALDAYTEAIDARVRGGTSASAVALAFLLTRFPAGDVVSSRRRASLTTTLKRWTAKADRQSLQQIAKLLKAARSEEVEKGWDKYVDEVKERGWRARFWRGGR